MPNHPHQEAVARCPTKQRHNRGEAIARAILMGYPVTPYKCPNGWDHWHVGKSRKKALDFYHHRDQWEARRRNQDRQDGGEDGQHRPPDC